MDLDDWKHSESQWTKGELLIQFCQSYVEPSVDKFVLLSVGSNEYWPIAEFYSLEAAKSYGDNLLNAN